MNVTEKQKEIMLTYVFDTYTKKNLVPPFFDRNQTIGNVELQIPKKLDIF